MANIVFIFLVVVATGVIVFIILRKFFQLSNLDLESLDEEKEGRKKKEIIIGKVNERSSELKNEWKKKFTPLVNFWKKKQLSFRVYTGRIERLFRHEQSVKDKEEEKNMTTIDKEKKLADLLKVANINFENKEFDKAEELYISAIKIDSKLAVAYRGLAETFLKKGDTEEAMQTFNFLSQLTPDDDALFVRLGDIYEEQGSLEKAIRCYEQSVVLNDAIAARFYHLADLLLRVKQAEVAMESIAQAVELEPKNPKYLDLLIECAIICNMISVAKKGIEDLRLVNPENHKLDEFKERIAKIGKN